MNCEAEQDTVMPRRPYVRNIGIRTACHLTVKLLVFSFHGADFEALAMVIGSTRTRMVFTGVALQISPESPQFLLLARFVRPE